MIYPDITGLIGSTPLVELRALSAACGCRARVLAKWEACNPSGSAKDRAALSMIRQAERDGALAPGGLIIEPTSGNTGIGLAACAAVLGYRCCIVMPDSMSPERIRLMAAYGAEVVLTPGAEGMSGAIARAAALHAQTPGSLLAGQFDNPANPAAHYASTGPEIWADGEGQVDVLVCAVGTGGTLTGTARYLREQNPALWVVAVEPDASPLLSGGEPGPHAIQGIGANFIPSVLDRSLISEVFRCTDADALATMRALARQEGMLCGISSGAAAHAALTVARRPELAGKTVVCLLPDSGERYLSLW